MRAAAEAGYATKAVQLFYALSQAGRAICAARAGNPWQITRHGAEVDIYPDVGQTTVTLHRSGTGAIRAVAAATGSETWIGPVMLGALWGSLAELPFHSELCDNSPSVLELERDDYPILAIDEKLQPLNAGLTARSACASIVASMTRNRSAKPSTRRSAPTRGRRAGRSRAAGSAPLETRGRPRSG